MNHLLLEILLKLNFFSKFKVGYTFLSLPYFTRSSLICDNQITDSFLNFLLLLNEGNIVFGHLSLIDCGVFPPYFQFFSEPLLGSFQVLF